MRDSAGAAAAIGREHANTMLVAAAIAVSVAAAGCRAAPCGGCAPWETCDVATDQCALNAGTRFDLVAVDGSVPGDNWDPFFGPPDPYICASDGAMEECSSIQSDDATPTWNDTLLTGPRWRRSGERRCRSTTRTRISTRPISSAAARSRSPPPSCTTGGFRFRLRQRLVRALRAASTPIAARRARCAACGDWWRSGLSAAAGDGLPRRCSCGGVTSVTDGGSVTPARPSGRLTAAPLARDADGAHRRSRRERHRQPAKLPHAPAAISERWPMRRRPATLCMAPPTIVMLPSAIAAHVTEPVRARRRADGARAPRRPRPSRRRTPPRANDQETRRRGRSRARRPATPPRRDAGADGRAERRHQSTAIASPSQCVLAIDAARADARPAAPTSTDPPVRVSM